MSVQAIGWVFDHETETGGLTRLVLLSLANHANDVGECWPSKATIGRETNCQREPSIRAALRELEKRGLVETVVNGAPDARVPVDKRPNLYRLTFMAGRRSASTGDGAGRRFSSERVDGFRASGATDTVYQTIIEPSENHHRETREPKNSIKSSPKSSGTTGTQPNSVNLSANWWRLRSSCFFCGV